MKQGFGAVLTVQNNYHSNSFPPKASSVILHPMLSSFFIISLKEPETPMKWAKSDVLRFPASVLYSKKTKKIRKKHRFFEDFFVILQLQLTFCARAHDVRTARNA